MPLTCKKLQHSMNEIIYWKAFQLYLAWDNVNISQSKYKLSPKSICSELNSSKTTSFWSFHFRWITKILEFSLKFSVIIYQSNVTHFMSMNYKSFSASCQMSGIITFAVTSFHCRHALLFISQLRSIPNRKCFDYST